MFRAIVLASLMIALVAPAARADEFSPLRDRSAFLAMVKGRDLTLPLWRIRLNVRPDGAIDGTALGMPVTGTWAWQDGLFCRRMEWNGREIPHNCQLVEARGPAELRFTTDQGRGQSARFRLE